MKYPPVEDVGQIIEKAYTVRDRIERKPKSRKMNAKFCFCLPPFILFSPCFLICTVLTFFFDLLYICKR